MEYKITITTTQTDYKGKSIFEHAANDLMIDETFSMIDEEGVMSTSLFGTLDSNGCEYTLRYEEENENMGNTFTEVRFNSERLNELSLVRTGEVESFMTFEEGKRHICVYETGIMPFEICIFTRSLDNRLLTEGTLNIKYIVEIKGACAQQTEFKMEIVRV
ncbi:MAG: DUF1934 domain-containing protein [Clostridia bacterium]|nr:DUF1934 domain-containing protein [Clostridia bacterium]